MALLTYLQLCHKAVWMKVNTLKRLATGDDSKSKYFICEILFWKLVADSHFICFFSGRAKTVRWASSRIDCNFKTNTSWLRNKIIYVFWFFNSSFSIKVLNYLWLGFLQGQKAFSELRMTLYSSLLLLSFGPQSASLISATEAQQQDPEEEVYMRAWAIFYFFFNKYRDFVSRACHFKKFQMS